MGSDLDLTPFTEEEKKKKKKSRTRGYKTPVPTVLLATLWPLFSTLPIHSMGSVLDLTPFRKKKKMYVTHFEGRHYTH